MQTIHWMFTIRKHYIYIKNPNRKENEERQKKKNPFTFKSLEFLISRKIEEAEFVELIHKMKECGFSSTVNNIRIQFIDIKDNPHTPLYDYDFITLERNEPETYSNVNKYTYDVKYIDIFKSK